MLWVNLTEKPGNGIDDDRWAGGADPRVSSEAKAQQVKDIILESVVKPNHPVYLGNGKNRRPVRMDEISVSGGVVNAYRALEMAGRK